MRAWENRPDTVVVDEPLYAAYLPAPASTIRAGTRCSRPQPTSRTRWSPALTRRRPGRRRPLRQAHGPPPPHQRWTLGWTAAFRNVLLIRDPAEVVASYVRSREACEPDDIGLLQQQWLMTRWDRPASTSRSSTPPTSCTTRSPTCAGCATGWASTSPTGCWPGRPARGTPTASGRRTGTTPCSPRPASSRTARERSTSRPHDAAVAEACRPAYDALRERRVRR